MKVKEIIITDSLSELISTRWDGERLAISHYHKLRDVRNIIILNPKELLELVKFLKSIQE